MLRLGTRGSALALWQAHFVAGRLPVPIEIVVVKTTGDVRQDVPLSAVAGKGVFVREIEAALLRGEVDMAVHSAKDLQSSDPDGLTIGAFCERADPRDALVSPHGGWNELPHGVTVATSAPRRVAQLAHLRPDLRFVPIRGNVDTRLAKLERGDADALVLACAGLDRLNRDDVITERIPVSVCLPQVGQGAVAVQCRANDAATLTLVRDACDHTLTRAAVEAERAFLSRLGGGCTAPVAAHAVWEDGELLLQARVASPDGARLLHTSAQGSAGRDLAEQVYVELLASGARALLEALVPEIPIREPGPERVQ